MVALIIVSTIDLCMQINLWIPVSNLSVFPSFIYESLSGFTPKL